MELKNGITLQNGKYTIERKIGNGTFGITYVASMRVPVTGALGELETTMLVAIKEFFMSDLNSRSTDGTHVEGSQNTLVTNYRHKFRTEAQNLGQMKHPRIVRVLEVWDENNTTYYSMEYIEGVSLDDYIIQKGAIPEPQALKMFSQLTDAVHYMHSKRMLHLDIKPKNAMIRKNGDLTLIDFGLSKQYDAHGDPESSTRVGGGTPGYAPVEQADFHDGKGFPVTMDIYALGGTLYKMLSGKVPPVASAIVSEGFPSSNLSDKNVSIKTIAAIRKAMSPSKHDRQESVKQFVEEIWGNAPLGEETQMDLPQQHIAKEEINAVNVVRQPSTAKKLKEPVKDIHPVDKHRKTFVTINIISGFVILAAFLLFLLIY